MWSPTRVKLLARSLGWAHHPVKYWSILRTRAMGSFASRATVFRSRRLCRSTLISRRTVGVVARPRSTYVGSSFVSDASVRDPSVGAAEELFYEGLPLLAPVLRQLGDGAVLIGG